MDDTDKIDFVTMSSNEVAGQGSQFVESQILLPKVCPAGIVIIKSAVEFPRQSVISISNVTVTVDGAEYGTPLFSKVIVT